MVDFVSEQIEVLGKIGDLKVVLVLVKLFCDFFKIVWEMVGIVFVVIGQFFVDYLFDVLKDKDFVVRCYVVWVFGGMMMDYQIGWSWVCELCVVDVLIEMLKDFDWVVCEDVTIAFGMIGDLCAIDAFMEVMKDGVVKRYVGD